MSESLFVIVNSKGEVFEKPAKGEYYQRTWAFREKNIAEELCERGEHVEEYVRKKK